MSLAIILGYAGNSRNSPVQSLYTGLDLEAARKIAENPPVGVVRTEMVINPQILRTRFYPTNTADAAPADAAPADAPAEDASAEDAAPADNAKPSIKGGKK